MTQSAAKKKQVSYKNDNFLETLSSVPGSIGTSTVQEAGAIGSDIVTALLGGTPKAGKLEPNQVIELGGQKTEQTPEPVAAQRLEAYPKPNVDELERQTREQIQAIRQELKALASSLKSLHSEVQNAINEEPVHPGIYHLNFYEQLKSFITVLRQQIEDSRAWLATFNSRKKKIGYWGMYKKHGTSFGLSSERSIATAAG